MRLQNNFQRWLHSEQRLQSSIEDRYTYLMMPWYPQYSRYLILCLTIANYSCNLTIYYCIVSKLTESGSSLAISGNNYSLYPGYWIVSDKKIISYLFEYLNIAWIGVTVRTAVQAHPSQSQPHPNTVGRSLYHWQPLSTTVQWLYYWSSSMAQPEGHTNTVGGTDIVCKGWTHESTMWIE